MCFCCLWLPVWCCHLMTRDGSSTLRFDFTQVESQLGPKEPNMHLELMIGGCVNSPPTLLPVSQNTQPHANCWAWMTWMTWLPKWSWNSPWRELWGNLPFKSTTKKREAEGGLHLIAVLGNYRLRAGWLATIVNLVNISTRLRAHMHKVACILLPV